MNTTSKVVLLVFLLLIPLSLATAPTHDTPTLSNTPDPYNLTGFNKTTVDGDGDLVVNNWCFYNNSVQYACRFFNSSLLSYYHFDSNSILDYGGAGNDLSDTSTIPTTTFRLGGRNLSGSNYLDAGNPQWVNRNNYTIMFWVKCASASESNPGIIGETGDGSFYFYICEDASANIRIAHDSGTFFDNQGDFSDLAWHHVALIQNLANNRSLYKDGILIAEDNSNKGAIPSTTTYIGKLPPYEQYFTGALDEFQVYERALVSDEVLSIFTATRDIHTEAGGKVMLSNFTNVNDAWIFEVTPYDATNMGTAKNSTTLTIGDVENIALTISLLDENDQNITALFEGDVFKIAANYTINSVVVDSVVCNWTSSNISGHFSLDIDDVTLVNAGDRQSLTFTEGNDSIIQDEYSFTVCRTNQLTDLEIYVNGVLKNTLNTEISRCSLGNHTQTNVTKDVVGENDINITLICPNCDGGGQQITLLRDNSKGIIHWDRDFSRHSETGMIFNNTLLTNTYEKHRYNFRGSGVGFAELNVTCNQTTATRSLDVLNRNLTVSVVSINDITFTEAMEVEITPQNNITIEVFGDITNWISFNVSYANGTLIKSTSEEAMQLTNHELGRIGTYNITIAAEDDEENVISLLTYFSVNDTINPTITWTSPLKDNSSSGFDSQPFSADMTFSDVNLFAYNVTVRFPNGTISSSDASENLGVTSFNFLKNYTFLVGGIWVFDVEVSDDHTAKTIPDYLVYSGSDYLIFDEKIKIYSDDVIWTNYEKKIDRYEFELEWSSGFALDKVIIIESNCSRLIYRKDSKYKDYAHFVDPCEKKWIDFVNPYSKAKVKQLSANSYEITLKAEDVDKVDKIKFNSIGGLNIVKESVSVDITTLGAGYNIDMGVGNLFNNEVLATDTVSGALFWFLIVGILVGMIVLSLATRVPVFFFMTAIYGFFLAWMLGAAISILIGVAVSIFSIIFMFVGLLTLSD